MASFRLGQGDGKDLTNEPLMHLNLANISVWESSSTAKSRTLVLNINHAIPTNTPKSHNLANSFERCSPSDDPVPPHARSISPVSYIPCTSIVRSVSLLSLFFFFQLLRFEFCPRLAFGFLLSIFGTVLPEPVVRGRADSPMVIFNAVSSGVEARIFCARFIRDGWKVISTIKVWRLGISCRWPRIRHPTPISDTFHKRFGFVYGVLLWRCVCGILRIFFFLRALGSLE